MKNEKGFTLVELMIVIAIIGILAAIAIPQMTAYRNRAYNTAALSDCRNLITAMEAYHIDHGEYMGFGEGITLGGQSNIKTLIGSSTQDASY